MTHTTFSHPGPGAAQTITTFKQWAEALHNALLAIGMVQTADTGQINFASIVTLPTADTNAGYGIYELNDSLSGTHPIYLKVNYSVGQSSTAEPGFQFGTGTNGAGTLTGVFGSQRSVYNAGTTGSSTTDSIFCKVDGYLLIWMFKDMTVNEAQGQILVLERARNLDGSLRGDALLLYRSGYGADPGASGVHNWWYGYTYSDQTFLSFSQPVCLPSPFASSGLGGGVIPMFLMPLMWSPGTDPWQPIGIAGIGPTDNTGVPFSAYAYGASHQYWAPAYNATFGINTPPIYAGGATVQQAMALLWE